jgi:hypothetical protein
MTTWMYSYLSPRDGLTSRLNILIRAPPLTFRGPVAPVSVICSSVVSWRGSSTRSCNFHLILTGSSCGANLVSVVPAAYFPITSLDQCYLLLISRFCGGKKRNGHVCLTFPPNFSPRSVAHLAFSTGRFTLHRNSLFS